MKLDLRTMLVTIGVCMLFAFTASSILTIKPAMPKLIFTSVCRADSAATVIKKYSRLNYVIKSYTAGTEYDSTGLLIMEKY